MGRIIIYTILGAIVAVAIDLYFLHTDIFVFIALGGVIGAVLAAYLNRRIRKV